MNRLGSLSVVPLWCLRRLGISYSEEDAEAYLALWRHVGFYLGVSPEILSRYFSSITMAERFISTTVLDLFSDETIDVGSLPTIPILAAVSNRMPCYSSFEYNCAVSRFFLGPELATRLGIPPTPLWTKMVMHAGFFVCKIPVWFSHWYPRTSWAEKRREILSQSVATTVRWSLETQESLFRPRTSPASETLLLADINNLGKHNASEVFVMARKYLEVIAEMTAVHIAIGGLIVGVITSCIPRSH